MNDQTDDTNNDKSLFAQAVKGARKLAQDKIKPHRPRLKPIPHQRIIDEQASLQETISMPITQDDIETGEELIYSRGGVQNSVIRKLKRGHYPVEAELDLHRMTSAQAFEALVNFLGRCQQRGIRCVRIVHGKGLGSKEKKPVLKGKVNQWLQRRDDILAFCSAQPVDGGTGAVYVLLRRKK
jgi:DNA-nicking Smr family endonuclease